jgi:uncharacterized membrane protein
VESAATQVYRPHQAWFLAEFFGNPVKNDMINELNDVLGDIEGALWGGAWENIHGAAE